jgi:hypothetical protein
MGERYEHLCMAADQSGGVVRLSRIEDLVAVTLTVIKNDDLQAVGLVNRFDELDDAAEFALSWMRRRGLVARREGGRRRR